MGIKTEDAVLFCASGDDIGLGWWRFLVGNVKVAFLKLNGVVTSKSRRGNQ